MKTARVSEDEQNKKAVFEEREARYNRSNDRDKNDSDYSGEHNDDKDILSDKDVG